MEIGWERVGKGLEKGWRGLGWICWTEVWDRRRLDGLGWVGGVVG